MFALVLVAGYFTFVRRASLAMTIAIFFCWLFVYNLIEVIRTSPDWYSLSDFSRIFEQSQMYQQQSGESSFNITTMTLRATIEMVPGSHDYMYGVFKLIQLSSAIPYSGKLFLPYLDTDYTNSVVMLTDFMLGTNASWGPGTNVISDSFIDLGFPGVIFSLLAIGISAKLMRNYVASEPDRPYRVVMYLLTLATFAELPRYAIDVPIRILAWALIFLTIVKLVAGRRQKTGLDEGVSVRASDVGR